jgi:hypothetical protein
VSSSLPRLELAQMPATLAARLEPRVKRLGYLGEFFQCAGHNPRGLSAFVEFTEASTDGLSDRLVEVVALTCAVWMTNEYERNQHERLSVRLGFGRAWVAAVNALRPDADSMLTGEERTVQRLALAVLNSHGRAVAPLFEDVVRSLGPGRAISTLMTVGRCVAHGLIVNTLALGPPVPSIFEDGFAG